MTIASAAEQIFNILKDNYKDAKVSLHHSNPFQLLVATVLSAQCTDVRVNHITPKLFDKYPNPKSLAQAKLEELEAIIKPTGFFHNKAKNIISCCNELVDKYNSIVPPTLDELVALPGIGRKTANVILGNAYNKPAIVVDTHVKRLSNRLGLTDFKNPEKIEFALMKLLQKEHWTLFSILLILHGRKICNAKSPQCKICSIKTLCRHFNTSQGNLKNDKHN